MENVFLEVYRQVERPDFFPNQDVIHKNMNFLILTSGVTFSA